MCECGCVQCDACVCDVQEELEGNRGNVESHHTQQAQCICSLTRITASTFAALKPFQRRRVDCNRMGGGWRKLKTKKQKSSVKMQRAAKPGLSRTFVVVLMRYGLAVVLMRYEIVGSGD